MQIAIPSRHRADTILTPKQFPEEWLQNTYVVVPYDEGSKYRKANPELNIVERPKKLHGIANVRQWILVTSNDPHVFFMDDDLKIEARKKKGGKNKLAQATPTQVGDMFRLMQHWLEEGIAAVGLTSRFGNNWAVDDYQECFRPCMAYGLDAQVMEKCNIRFNDVELCEDYHVMISLLKAGYKNRMSNLYTVSETTVGKKGGVTYRTADSVLEAMKRMVALHAPYVSLRDVKGKTQGHDVGVELRVQWKKAYESSKQGKFF